MQCHLSISLYNLRFDQVPVCHLSKYNAHRTSMCPPHTPSVHSRCQHYPRRSHVAPSAAATRLPRDIIHMWRGSRTRTSRVSPSPSTTCVYACMGACLCVYGYVWVWGVWVWRTRTNRVSPTPSTTCMSVWVYECMGGMGVWVGCGEQEQTVCHKLHRQRA